MRRIFGFMRPFAKSPSASIFNVLTGESPRTGQTLNSWSGFIGLIPEAHVSQATVTCPRQPPPSTVLVIVIEQEGQLVPGPGEASQRWQRWCLSGELPGMAIGGLFEQIDMPGGQDFSPAIVLREALPIWQRSDDGQTVQAIHGSFPTHDRHSVWYSQVTQ